MIDPITAIGLATSAFQGIKSAINTGRELSDMAGQLGQWGKAISDLDYASAKADKPPWYKKLGGGVQADAVTVWMHKKKADDMREELRSYISLYYGPSAWEEIVRTESKMRVQQREAVYAAEERKAAIINWIVGILATGIAITIFTLVIYWIGVSQDKW